MLTRWRQRRLERRMERLIACQRRTSRRLAQLGVEPDWLRHEAEAITNIRTNSRLNRDKPIVLPELDRVYTNANHHG